MNVNVNNAAIVAVLFTKLADERFTMRSPSALIKGTDIPEGTMLDVAAQLGLRFRRRIADGAMLVERPVDAAEAQAIAARAQAIAARARAIVDGSSDAPISFDLDFSAQTAAALESERAARAQHSVGESLLTGDEEGNPDDEDNNFTIN